MLSEKLPRVILVIALLLFLSTTLFAKDPPAKKKWLPDNFFYPGLPQLTIPPTQVAKPSTSSNALGVEFGRMLSGVTSWMNDRRNLPLSPNTCSNDIEIRRTNSDTIKTHNVATALELLLTKGDLDKKEVCIDFDGTLFQKTTILPNLEKVNQYSNTMKACLQEKLGSGFNADKYNEIYPSNQKDLEMRLRQLSGGDFDIFNAQNKAISGQNYTPIGDINAIKKALSELSKKRTDIYICTAGSCSGNKRIAALQSLSSPPEFDAMAKCRDTSHRTDVTKREVLQTKDPNKTMVLIDNNDTEINDFAKAGGETQRFHVVDESGKNMLDEITSENKDSNHDDIVTFFQYLTNNALNAYPKHEDGRPVEEAIPPAVKALMAAVKDCSNKDKNLEQVKVNLQNKTNEYLDALKSMEKSLQQNLSTAIETTLVKQTKTQKIIPLNDIRRYLGKHNSITINGKKMTPFDLGSSEEESSITNLISSILNNLNASKELREKILSGYQANKSGAYPDLSSIYADHMNAKDAHVANRFFQTINLLHQNIVMKPAMPGVGVLTSNQYKISKGASQEITLQLGESTTEYSIKGAYSIESADGAVKIGSMGTELNSTISSSNDGHLKHAKVNTYKTDTLKFNDTAAANDFLRAHSDASAQIVFDRKKLDQNLLRLRPNGGQ
ncbi:MAG: hypothetical protein HQK52_06725 [Oligoflexia bacterium]|nr:hypothetical protein [Oligoflexia bacterium]